jgi:hypothetical protein
MSKRKRKALDCFLILVGLALLAILAKSCFTESKADIYAPTDSVVLTVGCLDTTFLNVANADSIWFKRWRDVGGQTLVDSAKETTFVRTGFAR